MDEPSKKLNSLIKKREISEREAIQERNKIDEVVQEREDALRIEEGKLHQAQLKLQELEQKKRVALRQRDSATIVSIERSKREMVLNVQQLESDISRCKAELERAQLHATHAEDDIVQARVEKKKVERLLSKRLDEKRAIDLARDEALQDESITSGKKRK